MDKREYEDTQMEAGKGYIVRRKRELGLTKR
jgi:hypothetical protein